MTSRRAEDDDQPTAFSPQPCAERLAIAGVSARAAAESAAHAGWRVTAIDAFGDLDQHPSVRALSMPRDFGTRFTATAAARAARAVEGDAVMYLSSFENHPRAVASLAAGRELLGNPPSVLRDVRDPLLVMRVLRARGFLVPSVRFTRPSRGTWLRKPLTSGGGRGVHLARPGARVPRGCYLQEFVEGTPASVVFLAAGGRAVPIGLSRQLVGERAFGAAGFTYCGSILAAAGDPQFAQDAALTRAASGLARAAAEAFGLTGVNGIDFVARGRVPFAIEINPRWSASVELVELAYGLSVFAAHASACRGGGLPDFDLRDARQPRGAIGKAIVFARRDVTVGDTRPWLGHRWSVVGDRWSVVGGRWPVVGDRWSVVGDRWPVVGDRWPAVGDRWPMVGDRWPGASTTDDWPPDTDHGIRDVPQPGERILAGRPVCTVFATGWNAAACHAALERRAAWVYAQLAAWERNVA